MASCERKKMERFRWMVSGKSKKDELSQVVKAKVDVSYSRKVCEWMFLIQEKCVGGCFLFT